MKKRSKKTTVTKEPNALQGACELLAAYGCAVNELMIEQAITGLEMVDIHQLFADFHSYYTQKGGFHGLNLFLNDCKRASHWKAEKLTKLGA